ncbi:oligosaccharide flippase family protein [Aeromonas veronii]|uniref:oligosaccharide flippase family protein n=1 Tax=Aeromonas veronii TaxID=654 RepID=UPI0013260CFB|nr:oligosaccharide flippase family protein [Aeromonas veronii]MXV31120.1 oligosaccharide flippase family protein [Aeromonas veronii]
MNSLFYKNVISNYICTAFLGGGVLVLYPIYINILGAKSWGIVSACLLIQSFMFFLDSGMAQIMPRDISRTGNHAKVYCGYLFYYVMIAFLGSALIFFCSKLLSLHWFNGVNDIYQLECSLKILSIQFFFQFLNNVNLGFWNGIQKQTIANKRLCTFFSLKHGLAFLLICFYKTPVSYVLAFAAVSVIEFIYNYIEIKRLYIKQDIIFDFNESVNIVTTNWHFSLSVIVGVVASQLDRVLLSKYVSVEMFGYYSLAVQYGLAFLQFQYPIIRALIPAISNNDDAGGQYRVLKTSVKFFACLTVPIFFVLSYPYEILLFITRNEAFVSSTVNVFRLVLISVLMNYIYGFIYSLMIKENAGKFIFISNFTAILVMLTYFFSFSDKSDIITGGWLWVINVSVCLFISSIFWFRRRLVCV